jgi:hypothetical protein
MYWHTVKGSSVLALLIALSAVASARADDTTYSYFYTTVQHNYFAAPNCDLTLNIYLQEVNSDQSSNSLLQNEHGLSAADVKVSFLSGSADFTINAATADTGTVSTGFDDPTSGATVDSGTSATVAESTDGPPFGPDLIGVEAIPQGGGMSLVLLGTVTIHTSSIDNASATFTVSGNANSVFGSTFTNDQGYNLDNNADANNPAGASSLYASAASDEFTIVTPEPASCLLLLATVPMMMSRKAGRSLMASAGKRARRQR